MHLYKEYVRSLEDRDEYKMQVLCDYYYENFLLKDIAINEDGTQESIYYDSPATFFKRLFENNYDKELEYQKKVYDKIQSSKELEEIQNKLESIGIRCCMYNVYYLCEYIKHTAKSRVFILLKPQIQDILDELKDVSSITFTNGDGSKITTDSNLVIKATLEALEAKKKSDKNIIVAQSIVSIDKITNKQIIQSFFINELSNVLHSYFKIERKKGSLISTPEQELVRYFLYLFGLSPAVVTDSRFRQLKGLASKINFNGYLSRFPIGDEHILLHLGVLKYSAWKSGKIDLNADLPTIELNENIYIPKNIIIDLDLLVFRLFFLGGLTNDFSLCSLVPSPYFCFRFIYKASQKPIQIRKAAVNTMQNNQILKLSDLEAQGKHIARLEGNRNLNPKAVKEKKKSMSETGLLVPAIIVDAQKAIEEGTEVVDFETGKKITEENAKDYVVLLDANHRYKAHLELKKEKADYDKDFYLIYSLNENESLEKILSEINISTNPWKGGDYSRGAALATKGVYPVLNFQRELTDKGYSLDSASKWIFLKGVGKASLVKVMNGEVADIFKQSEYVDRATKLINAALEVFDESFLKKRSLIDWIISKYDAAGDEKKAQLIEDMCLFLSTMDKTKAKEIQTAKGQQGIQSREDIINSNLNALWDKELL